MRSLTFELVLAPPLATMQALRQCVPHTTSMNAAATLMHGAVAAAWETACRPRAHAVGGRGRVG